MIASTGKFAAIGRTMTDHGATVSTAADGFLETWAASLHAAQEFERAMEAIERARSTPIDFAELISRLRREQAAAGRAAGIPPGRPPQADVRQRRGAPEPMRRLPYRRLPK